MKQYIIILSFLFSIKGFSALLNHFKMVKNLYRLRLARKTRDVTHLLFTNDSVIFSLVDMESATSDSGIYARC